MKNWALGSGTTRIAVARASFSAEDCAAEGSTETGTSATSGEHLRFYNEDYYLSDFQPGRNTVVDAESGELRFIDLRVTLNDPDGPMTPASKYGQRREALPGQFVSHIAGGGLPFEV